MARMCLSPETIGNEIQYRAAPWMQISTSISRLPRLRRLRHIAHAKRRWKWRAQPRIAASYTRPRIFQIYTQSRILTIYARSRNKTWTEDDWIARAFLESTFDEEKIAREFLKDKFGVFEDG